MKSRNLLKQQLKNIFFKSTYFNKKKFIPYGKQHISKDDIVAVTKILKSDYLTQGDQVPEFETSLSNFLKVNYSIAVNSGTSALHIACLALGLSKGDYLNEANIICKRPGTGITPLEWDNIIGKKLIRDVKNDQLLSWDDIENN